MTDIIGENALALSAHDESYDPIEDRLRAMVRRTIETMFEEELGRALYGRGDKAEGYRNGHRDRQLVGTFATKTVRMRNHPVGTACPCLNRQPRRWRHKPVDEMAVYLSPIRVIRTVALSERPPQSPTYPPSSSRAPGSSVQRVSQPRVRLVPV
jgi:transposase-like protein